MGVSEIDFHGAADFVIADHDDVVDVLAHDFQRLIVGQAAGHAVGDFSGNRSLDLLSSGKGKRVSWSAVGDYADYLCLQSRSIADGAGGRDAGAHANRHVDDIEIRNGFEQLNPIAGHTFHDVT